MKKPTAIRSLHQCEEPPHASYRTVRGSGSLRAVPPCLVTVAACVVLASCVTVSQPRPLATIGPKKIGAISCQWDPHGSQKPKYTSGASDLLVPTTVEGSPGGLLAAGILVGMKVAADAPGTGTVNNFSKAAGSPEKQIIIDKVREQLRSSGYTVKDSAPATYFVNVSWYGVHKNMDGKAFTKIVGTGTLKNSSGEIIWSGYTPCTAWYSPPRPFDTYKSNPSQYSKDFQETAAVFARLIVNINGMINPKYDPAAKAAQR